jgi:hypothetical protein
MRFLRLLAPVVLLVPLLLVTERPAEASVPRTFCNNHAYTYVVKNYSRGAARLPLRCGTSTWGFRHITHRWDAAFDSSIALTIARGEVVNDLQQDGGSHIYALFNDRCTELFRVIYNAGAYRGNGVRPQGIITGLLPGRRHHRSIRRGRRERHGRPAAARCTRRRQRHSQQRCRSR